MRGQAIQLLYKTVPKAYVLRKDLRWYQWGCPKDEDGKLDVKHACTGDDLIDFVDNTLFPYLKPELDLRNPVKLLIY